MAKWNKKLGLVLLNLGLLTTTPNFANTDCCYDPCCDPCSFGGFEIGADFLYWKPCVDNLDYAAVAYSPDPAGTGTPSVYSYKYSYKCLCLDWEPGFRIRVGKDDVWCNWRLDGSYTWLDIKDSASFTKPDSGVIAVASPLFHPALGGILGVPGEFPRFDQLKVVAGKYDTTYQTWDVLLSYDIACNRCHSFQPFFGVEGLILNQKIGVVGLVNPETEDSDVIAAGWNSDYFGVGLKIGTNYEFQMFDCLKFYGNASGVITVGDHDGKYKGSVYNTSGSIVDLVFNDGDCCQFLPGYHLGVGFLYETDACGCEFALRFGWEFVQWHNVSNPRAFSFPLFDPNSEDLDSVEYFSSSSDYTTFGLHGLTVGLDFTF